MFAQPRAMLPNSSYKADDRDNVEVQSVDVAAPQHALLRCDAISLVVLLAV